MDTAVAVKWHLKGTVLIACNCDYGCPCNFNAPPTTGDCEGGWIWHIEDGQFGDTQLDGLNISMVADWPSAIHEGNGEAILLVDEQADDTQREALLSLLNGKAGGPWAVLTTTFSKVHEPQFVRFDITLNGEHTTARAGDVVALAMTPIRNPVTGAEAHPKAVLPEGFITKEGSFATSETFRVDDGLHFDHSGKYTAFGPFDYKGP